MLKSSTTSPNRKGLKLAVGNLRHFLIKFRPEVGELSDITAFDDAEIAARALAEAEREAIATDQELQVVLLTAASEDILRLTHPHYFEASSPASEDEYAAI